VPLLVEGEYEKTGQLLLVYSRVQDASLGFRAQMSIKAGILLELACKPEGAKQTWRETARWFPPNRCCFFADVAQGLSRGGEGTQNANGKSAVGATLYMAQGKVGANHDLPLRRPG